MTWVSIIVTAFLCGVAFAAFLAPVVIFAWWLDRTTKKDEARDG